MEYYPWSTEVLEAEVQLRSWLNLQVEWFGGISDPISQELKEPPWKIASPIDTISSIFDPITELERECLRRMEVFSINQYLMMAKPGRCQVLFEDFILKVICALTVRELMV